MRRFGDINVHCGSSLRFYGFEQYRLELNVAIEPMHAYMKLTSPPAVYAITHEPLRLNTGRA